MIGDYRALNMGKEIEAVVISVSTISSPLLNFGYRQGRDNYEESERIAKNELRKQKE